jgi:hypothetical protein
MNLLIFRHFANVLATLPATAFFIVVVGKRSHVIRYACAPAGSTCFARCIKTSKSHAAWLAIGSFNHVKLVSKDILDFFKLKYWLQGI